VVRGFSPCCCVVTGLPAPPTQLVFHTPHCPFSLRQVQRRRSSGLVPDRSFFLRSRGPSISSQSRIIPARTSAFLLLFSFLSSQIKFDVFCPRPSIFFFLSASPAAHSQPFVWCLHHSFFICDGSSPFAVPPATLMRSARSSSSQCCSEFQRMNAPPIP